ncbi:beta-lactamase class A [Ameyamaea chiangmaiensis NBRC 103196]|uniref:Beta-lactamase n=1 Tax=Ameyamaea chiangmaiensis TaxID=442969 RepID=A0A850PCB1_9PROT|nr:class A beta-lactamase [Ameyamaea chiangmaiensis]MBS4075601.1 class A beta-lactamase [Ameyamaea chiangmaiensis]NVN40160.1 class A beta-lactamase [Ameyamaea chiangmaiensis]GBQ70802.1 beta-lactamase class A [Ameyamaea chiangmaiensis NBRC 103196]
MLDRRTFAAGSVALAAGPAFGASAPFAALVSYERASGGRIGVYARNMGTGRTLSWRSGERFVLCSTFKASLVALVLRRVDQHQDDLAANVPLTSEDVPDWHAPVARENLSRGFMTVREMCDAAVRFSDNSCANLLLRRVGGPPAVTALWRSVGDIESRLDDGEPDVNRTPPGGVGNTTTPSAMAHSFGALVLGDTLIDSSKRLLTGWLLANTTGTNRLRGGLPSSWRVADKTGNNARDVAADVAIAWPPGGAPVIIAAYTRGGAPTAALFETVFRAVGQEVGATLG